MPRIAGVDIPAQKRTEIALRYIYGVGPTRATEICKKAGVDPGVRANKLTEEEISQTIREVAVSRDAITCLIAHRLSTTYFTRTQLTTYGFSRMK